MKVSWGDYSGWYLHKATVGVSVASDMDFFPPQRFILLYLQVESPERQTLAHEYLYCSVYVYLFFFITSVRTTANELKLNYRK